MEKKFIFGSDENGVNSSAIPADMFYAYSPICKEFKTFTLKESCIENAHSDMFRDPYDYEYISAVTREKYPEGTTIVTECDFESYGAPLVVFSNDISRVGAHYIYGAHFEIVAYEGGCNIWYIIPDPTNSARPVATSKIAFKNFEIANKERITIAVTVGKARMDVDVNGEKISVEHPEIPSTFHAGITACEGLNRFYNFSVKEDK